MDEPYLLTSFPVPSTSKACSPSVTSVCYASASAKKQLNRLLVAAPGVGLTFYDLVDQTALSSITLGSTFAPCTAAASRSTSTSTSHSALARATRHTWIAVSANQRFGDDSNEDESRGEIWQWTEGERKDGSAEAAPSKLVYPISAPIVALLAPRTLPNHLLLLAATGTLALASSENLAIVASLSLTPRSPTLEPLRSQSLHAVPVHSNSTFLPRSILDLLPARKGAHVVLVQRTFTRQDAAVTNAVTKKSKRKSMAYTSTDAADALESTAFVKFTEIELVLLDPEVETDDEMPAQARLVSLGSVSVSGEQVVVSEDGFVTALRGGSLVSYRLGFPAQYATTTYEDLFNPPETALTELSLTVIKTQRLADTLLAPAQTTILALHSSFLLLCSMRPPIASSDDASSTVVSLLWDVRLGAIVSSNSVGVPSSVSVAEGCQLALSLPTPHTATFTITPPATEASSGSSSAGRVAVFCVPLNAVPSTSVLAAVVGKQHLTRQYLAAHRNVDESVRLASVESMVAAKLSTSKSALLEASVRARAAVLGEVERCLKSDDADTTSADAAFDTFIKAETKRLHAYHVAKLESSLEKERERRLAALRSKDALKLEGPKYKAARRKIEEAIRSSGLVPDAWPEVTAKRIKGVSDAYRYKYYEDRKQLEQTMGKVGVDQSREKSLAAIEKHESILPSAFLTALLRLCFPQSMGLRSHPASSVSGKAQIDTSTALRSHPCGIVAYLLDRGLVGDAQLQGSLVRDLALAEDWPNVLKAVSTLPDVPEAITTSILRRVVSAHLSSSPSAKGMPRLQAFLHCFAKCPNTPSRLQEALRTQLAAVEALAVLQVCDKWLGWWSRHGGAGHAAPRASTDVEEKAPKRLPVDPFSTPSLGSDAQQAQPPRIERILLLVQTVLDAHFISLLLHRPSHTLLRRLSQRVSNHLAQCIELESLVGVLAIYSRTKKAQRKAAGALDGRALDSQTQNFERGLGESMRRRVEAQEKHAQVGMYEVEPFYL